jgi:ubiquinone/menaquinone biosynthesis C-methylase UbiE
MAINFEKRAPFRLRSNPLRTGTNLNRANENTSKLIEEKIQHDIFTYTTIQISNYTLYDYFSNLTSNYNAYCATFRTDILELFGLILKSDQNKARLTILDIGPGLAVAAREIQAKLGNEADVFGLDILEFKQEDAEPNLERIDIIRGMAESLPFIDGGLFNLILSHRAICNSLAPLPILDEITRILRPNGTALLEFQVTDKTYYGYYNRFISFLSSLSGKEKNKSMSYVSAKPLIIKRGSGKCFGIILSKPREEAVKDYFVDLAENRGLQPFARPFIKPSIQDFLRLLTLKL